jgi:hypothetical protein
LLEYFLQLYYFSYYSTLISTRWLEFTYAQLPGISPPPPQDQQQKSSQRLQNSSFAIYKDPAGKFSTEYPLDWIVKPKQNRFQAFDVQFSASSISNGYIAIIFSPLNSSIPESLLPTASTNFLKGFSSVIPGFLQVGETNYTKYKVAGHDAASIEFTTSLGPTQGFNFAGLLVYSLVDQNQFALIYSADQNVYDKVLPRIERMIESFRPSSS